MSSSQATKVRRTSRRLDCKGISEVIAVMMIIAITIAGGVILYAYSSGLLGTLQGANPPQPYKHRLALEYYDWSPTTNLNLTLRNVGVAEALLADFFVDGVLATASFDSGCPAGVLSVQGSCRVTLSGFGTVVTGVGYLVKVVTVDGAIFSFTLVAGRIG
jgi:hypothetical protein